MVSPLGRVYALESGLRQWLARQNETTDPLNVEVPSDKAHVELIGGE